jgi:hypothetical protein
MYPTTNSCRVEADQIRRIMKYTIRLSSLRCQPWSMRYLLMGFVMDRSLRATSRIYCRRIALLCSFETGRLAYRSTRASCKMSYSKSVPPLASSMNINSSHMALQVVGGETAALHIRSGLITSILRLQIFKCCSLDEHGESNAHKDDNSITIIVDNNIQATSKLVSFQVEMPSVSSCHL